MIALLGRDPRTEIVFFQCSKYLTPCLSYFKGSIEKYAAIFMDIFTCYLKLLLKALLQSLVFFPSSLCYLFYLLYGTERFCFGNVCLVSKGFLYLAGHLFLKIWEIFCYYFVEYVAYSLACTSSPSSMPMIHSFGLLME
jgi:hypothetical protein